jgi:hypothetical protein
MGDVLGRDADGTFALRGRKLLLFRGCFDSFLDRGLWLDNGSSIDACNGWA